MAAGNRSKLCRLLGVLDFRKNNKLCYPNRNRERASLEEMQHCRTDNTFGLRPCLLEKSTTKSSRPRGFSIGDRENGIPHILLSKGFTHFYLLLYREMGSKL